MEMRCLPSMKPPVAVNASADDFQMTVTLVLWPVAAVHIHKPVNHTIRAVVTTLMLIKRYNNDVRFIHTYPCSCWKNSWATISTILWFVVLLKCFLLSTCDCFRSESDAKKKIKKIRQKTKSCHTLIAQAGLLSLGSGVNAALVSLFLVVLTQHCPWMSLTVTLNYRFLLLSQLLNVATFIHFTHWVAFRKDEIVAPNRQNGPLVQAVKTEWAAHRCLWKCRPFIYYRGHLRLWRCLISVCYTTTESVQLGEIEGLRSNQILIILKWEIKGKMNLILR